MGLISGVHHISMNCEKGAEYQKVLEFYCDVLGLSVVREWADGVMISAGGTLLEIFTNGGGIRQKGAIRHIAFAADDPDACAETVRQAGYPILVEPKDVVIPAEPPYPARVAFCEGPLHEEIEFFCVQTSDGGAV